MHQRFPVLFISAAFVLTAHAGPLDWPEPSAENKPWTRWWWLGSAVDKPNLTRELEAFAKAGIGGVEICPIYGAMGAEDRFIPFLSPQWMEMLAHTTAEAERLGMRVDLTTGTGWPFGGPTVTTELASKALQRIHTRVEGGAPVSLKLPAGELQCLMAFPENGKPVDLTGHAARGRIEWTPPAGDWTITGIATKSGIQKVKRAAPGAEGLVLDPFCPASMNAYLAGFDRAFAGFKAPMPRAQFHDSFEYYGADWTPGLFDAFKRSRGYDLRERMAEFNGNGDSQTVTRVRADYRETLGELHQSYLQAWRDWARKHGAVTRNQAHGSPGNLLDHYAVAGIPETEIFRHVAEDQIPMLRFAASAAHSNGTHLVSSETFTWLGEHFQVTPESLKEAADFVFLGGVNHILFHGIPYSPADAGWPGWLFYASTHMGPHGGLWRDLPAFNSYLSRCQSILQEGRPDSEVLIYFPFADTIHGGEEKLPLFTIHNQNQWLHASPFHKSAMELWETGITFDFASDAMLRRTTVRDGAIILGSNEFKVLVIPQTKRMPLETMRRIERLSAAGARIVFHGTNSEELDVPGLHDVENRRAEVNVIRRRLAKPSPDLIPTLRETGGITPEPMRAMGLRFVRRKHASGHLYFIVNRSGKTFDGPITLARDFRSAAVLDPMHADRKGVIQSREIPLRLAPNESIVIRTFVSDPADGPPWSVPQQADSVPINGPWQLEFIDGGPSLPGKANLPQTGAWTTLDDPACKTFAGTARYSTTFVHDGKNGGHTRIDLGKVAHTARVSLNAREVGISWCPPHILDVSPFLKSGENTLSIEVSNLAANRIADLDRRKVEWKRFHEINFVNIDYKPFDAANWPTIESGLVGPVRLISDK